MRYAAGKFPSSMKLSSFFFIFLILAAACMPISASVPSNISYRYMHLGSEIRVKQAGKDTSRIQQPKSRYIRFAHYSKRHFQDVKFKSRDKSIRHESQSFSETKLNNTNFIVPDYAPLADQSNRNQWKRGPPPDIKPAIPRIYRKEFNNGGLLQ